MTDRWTLEQYQEYLKSGRTPDTQPKKPKYGNRRTEHRGEMLDSQREANRAAELDMLVRAGEIAGYATQVPFLLAGGIVYVADFVVLGFDRQYTIEDAKGVRTDVYKLKKRLMAEKGLEIVEV